VNALAFELPAALEAREPAEARGIARDGVRLMVARAGVDALADRRFSELADVLAPGDLVVVNVSATLPAAIPARRGSGAPVRAHVSTRAPRLDGAWRVVELRSADGVAPARAAIGERLALHAGASLELVAPYASGARLMLARFSGDGDGDGDRGRSGSGSGTIERHLERFGEPIRYGYVRRAWPLADYQNVYATTPGSAEMPSAGRPFTAALITRLVVRGIAVAPVTLHCGVSSPERHEPPFPEQYEVTGATARAVASVRAGGGRVIAAGTTVVRALESAAAGSGGELRAASGWSGVVVTPENPPRVVDGLITGWHEPEASHLQMLEALAGRELIARSYEAALARGYLWHEFGDSHLILTR
jgi:S-adenosylmethionine:tRNA ribosyltransferase-isomerase